jgi:hypothetical protein
MLIILPSGFSVWLSPSRRRISECSGQGNSGGHGDHGRYHRDPGPAPMITEELPVEVTVELEESESGMTNSSFKFGRRVKFQVVIRSSKLSRHFKNMGATETEMIPPASLSLSPTRFSDEILSPGESVEVLSLVLVLELELGNPPANLNLNSLRVRSSSWDSEPAG